MAAPMVSTKEKLSSLLRDIEILSRELFDEATSNYATRGSSTTIKTRTDQAKINQILDTLVSTDATLQETLVTAKEQTVTQQRIDSLTQELEKRNNDIILLQKSLKEAETVLASAVFEAKKKLASIKNAEEKAVSAEELIRFAHRISASGAVAAPPNWVPGDPSRRPYPTDTEMRLGFLNKNFQALSEAYQSQSQQSGIGFQSADSGLGMSSSQWQSQSSDISVAGGFMASSLSQHMSMKSETNDVEIMSQSDTSSSSSSDEQ